MNTSKHVKLYDHKDISYRLLSSYHYACADVECFNAPPTGIAQWRSWKWFLFYKRYFDWL